MKLCMIKISVRIFLLFNKMVSYIKYIQLSAGYVSENQEIQNYKQYIQMSDNYYITTINTINELLLIY